MFIRPNGKVGFTEVTEHSTETGDEHSIDTGDNRLIKW